MYPRGARGVPPCTPGGASRGTLGGTPGAPLGYHRRCPLPFGVPRGVAHGQRRKYPGARGYLEATPGDTAARPRPATRSVSGKAGAARRQAACPHRARTSTKPWPYVSLVQRDGGHNPGRVAGDRRWAHGSYPGREPAPRNAQAAPVARGSPMEHHGAPPPRGIPGRD